jgi:hypothetical protein
MVCALDLAPSRFAWPAWLRSIVRCFHRLCVGLNRTEHRANSKGDYESHDSAIWLRGISRISSVVEGRNVPRISRLHNVPAHTGAPCNWT